MAHDDTAVDAPLMRDAESPRESLDQPSIAFPESTSPNAFIWALTVTAGISGILFGYE